MAEAPNGELAQGNSRRAKALGILAVVLVLAVGLGGFYWWYRETHISTDDAFVDGDIHMVAPRIQGKVVEVLVRSNQAVKAGQPLLKMDPEPFEVQEAAAASGLAAATADLKAAEQDLVAGRAELTRILAGVEAGQSKVTLAETELAQAERNATREQSLMEKKVVSREDYEKTITDRDVARAQADYSKRLLSLANATVAMQEAAIAQREARIAAQAAVVKQKESMLAEAKLNRQYTVIEAPVDGYVTRKSVEAGQVVSPGQPLLAVVPLSDVWVNANFKETDIEHIHPGQTVQIKVDTYSGKEFRGKVESLMAGTGSAFSLFPPENATGNYVKVVQRVPVKIVLDQGTDPEHVLRVGMSVVPTVVVR